MTAFPLWVSALLVQLEGSVPRSQLKAAEAELLRRHAGAFRPDGRHKRSVLPGRYQRELKPETIATAMRENEELFALLGYPGLPIT